MSFIELELVVLCGGVGGFTVSFSTGFSLSAEIFGTFSDDLCRFCSSSTDNLVETLFAGRGGGIFSIFSVASFFS